MLGHFIITRFNLRFSDRFSYEEMAGQGEPRKVFSEQLAFRYSHDKRGNSTQSGRWLTERIALFETFCLPSIAAQTNPDFTWLVLFDKTTEKEYAQELELYKKICPQFTPCFLKEGTHDDMVLYLQQTIRPLCAKKNISRMITTRIDNDDAFHRDTVEAIQVLSRQVDEKDFLINIDYGYQYDVSQMRLWQVRYIRNHFLSRVESVEDCQTIMTQDHTTAGREYPLHTIDNNDKPMWIEILHPRNLSNQLRRESRPFTEAFPAYEFGLTDY